MPKQNRVTPKGEIIATKSRGTLMGNRGKLHDSGQRIVRTSDRKAWISCELDYNDRHRDVMAPGQYTELFFLDEATAMAAGHRPCGTCRRSVLKVFREIWSDVILESDGSIADIDQTLHAQRLASVGQPALWSSRLSSLPDGTFFTYPDDDEVMYIVWDNGVHRWSASGYMDRQTKDHSIRVNVITPGPMVRVMNSGFLPSVHPSLTLTAEQQLIAAKRRSDEKQGHTPDNPQFATLFSGNPYSRADTALQGEQAALHRLVVTPSGGELFVYFAAILQLTGMDRGKVYPLKNFLGNFSGHVSAKRIEKVDGGFRLTEKGMDYFKDRYKTGSKQHVDEQAVQAMVRRIKLGGDGWMSVS